VVSSLRLHSLFTIHVSLSLSDLPDINHEQLGGEEEDEPQNHLFLPSKLFYRVFLNLAETTHTPNLLRNLYFLLVKRSLTQLFNGIFLPTTLSHLYVQISNEKCDPYKSLTWEIKVRKRPVDVKTRQKSHFVSRATITVKINDNNDEYLAMTLKEDIIEGYRGSEYDSEKVHSIGVHIAHKKIAHIGQIIRLAKTIVSLDDVKEK